MDACQAPCDHLLLPSHQILHHPLRLTVHWRKLRLQEENHLPKVTISRWQAPECKSRSVRLQALSLSVLGRWGEVTGHWEMESVCA